MYNYASHRLPPAMGAGGQGGAGWAGGAAGPELTSEDQADLARLGWGGQMKFHQPYIASFQ